MSLADHGIYTNLRGTVCACGDAKDAGKSFCRGHYFKLPQPKRSALYQRVGYPDAYRDALNYLGLEEPKVEPQTLRDVFPDRGPIRRNPFRRPIR